MINRKKKKTAELIIEASRKLFNEHTERKITTNHISSYLGISPGNLYYYFSNKESIILELFNRYQQELMNLFSKKIDFTHAKEALQLVNGIFSIMWKYRFIYISEITFLYSNDELKQNHKNFINNKVVPAIRNIFLRLKKNNIINIPNEDIEYVQINVWLVCRYWIIYQQSLDSKITKDVKMNGDRQLMTVFKPYINDEYIEEYEKAFKEVSTMDFED